LKCSNASVESIKPNRLVSTIWNKASVNSNIHDLIIIILWDIIRNIILIYIVVNNVFMGRDFIKRPSQIEPDLREVFTQKTAEPLPYNETDPIDDDNELMG
jgi:hypothetical protein